MLSSQFARHAHRHLIFLLGCAVVAPSAVYAGPLTEAEALSRAVALPETNAFDQATQEAADAEATAIRRFENPELHLARERVSGPLGSETEWGAELTQPLGINGASGRLRAAARAESLAITADISRRKATRIADVRKAYAQCGAAAEKAAAQKELDDRLAAIERIIGLRARAGDAAGYDLRRVRLEARMIAAERILADGEVVASCATLSRLTGEAEARTGERLSLLLQPSRPLLDGQNRSDLEAQRHRVAAAEASAEAARRQRLPDLAIGAGYKRIEEGGTAADGPTLSIGLKLPLFGNGGAKARAAEARKRAAEAELALSTATVLAERDAAFARAEAAYDAALIAERSAEDATRVADISEAAYQGGETGITELIDGYRASAEARIAAIELAERALVARADHLLAQEGEME